MKLLRIAIAAAVIGLVAYWPIALMPSEWYGWVLLIVALVLLVAVAIDNGEKLAELKKLHWLRLWEWTEKKPEESSPVPDAHLLAGLVEPDSQVQVLRPNPKDDESIRRA